MNRRPAATLIEVLVAIFVTSIGLLALLALFPLGAINMAQAIKDSRCATAAANGAAVSEVFQVRNDPSLFNSTTTFDAYLNPNVGGPLPSLSTYPGYDTSSSMLGPSSYPVYVDYVGASIMGSTTVGGMSPGITRVSPSFISSLSQFYRYCGLLDDINFDPAGAGTPNGAPWPPPPGPIEREDRYTWSYMLRRPRAFATSLVDCSIVVYSGRPISVLGENSYFVNFTAGTNTVTVDLVNVLTNVGKAKPAIRNGTWILDATVATNPYAGPFTPDPHGTFYRVVSVTEQPGNVFNLELQTNIRQNSATPGAGMPPNGVLVVMENVVEVFEKGSGWRP